MTRKELVNNVLLLQVNIILKFMERHSITAENFLELDEKHNIIGFLENGYYAFHLTGDEGVLDEIDEYITEECNYVNTNKCCSNRNKSCSKR